MTCTGTIFLANGISWLSITDRGSMISDIGISQLPDSQFMTITGFVFFCDILAIMIFDDKTLDTLCVAIKLIYDIIQFFN
jgi:hypothetical protein